MGHGGRVGVHLSPVPSTQSWGREAHVSAGPSECSAPTPLPSPPPRDDHIGALLAVRGDASRDMKQTIIESLEQGPTQASPNYVPIFREIMVPSLNVAKLLK